jgi:hypothetical protein
MVATTVAAMVLVGAPGVAAADPVGQVEAMTESSTTVVRPDGARTLTLRTGPTQLRRGAGWVPVDLSLVTGADGVVRPAAAQHDLELTPIGPVVRFAGGGSAALDWSTPLPAPVLDRNRATYPRALPGHDLVVEATSVGFVASLRRIPGAAAGPVPHLALRSTAATAAPLVEAESAVSRVVAAAPHVDGVPFDTTVQTTVLRSDTSSEPDLRLGSYDGREVARSFLTFDLGELIGRPVASAVLRVHQDWSSSCRARAWEVWTSPAAGPATRWANQPAAQRRVAVSGDTRGHDPSCAAGWTSVDVTPAVREWVSAGARSGTLQLRAADEADPLSWKRFGSAESPTPPSLDLTLIP